MTWSKHLWKVSDNIYTLYHAKYTADINKTDFLEAAASPKCFQTEFMYLYHNCFVKTLTQEYLLVNVLQ